VAHHQSQQSIGGEGAGPISGLTIFSHTFGTAVTTPTDTFTLTGGTVSQFGNFNWDGLNKLTIVATNDPINWGLSVDGTFRVSSFSSAFDGCSILTTVPTTIPSSIN
jgi:hypothetical protein